MENLNFTWLAEVFHWRRSQPDDDKTNEGENNTFSQTVCAWKKQRTASRKKSGTSEWKSQICQVLGGVGNSFYFKNLCKCDDCNIINYLGGGRERSERVGWENEYTCLHSTHIMFPNDFISWWVCFYDAFEITIVSLLYIIRIQTGSQLKDN